MLLAEATIAVAAMVAVLRDQALVLLAQADTPAAAGLFQQVGIPMGFLIITLGAVRAMWTTMSRRDTETLEREIRRTAAAEAREQELHKTIREQIVPALTQSTAATVEAIQILRRERP